MSEAVGPGTRVLISRYDPEYAVRAERTLAGAGLNVDTLDSLKEIRDRVLGATREAPGQTKLPNLRIV